MKTTWIVLLAAVGLIWSASWVSACDGCGCKGKAKGEEAKVAATEAPAKCVACPRAQKGEDGKAVTCPGNCKADCCKGDAAKCADCPKACKAQACGAAAKTCGAAVKGCGAKAAGEAKACGAAPAARACGAAPAARACGAAKAD